MNSTGIIIIYDGEVYVGRLVNFTVDTATPSDSTGARSRTDNFTFILVVVVAGVLGPLIIVIIVLAVVIIAVKKVSIHTPSDHPRRIYTGRFLVS